MRARTSTTSSRFISRCECAISSATGCRPRPRGVKRARVFGDLGAVRDACLVIDERRQRRHTRAEVIESMWNDVKFAARALRKSPGFAAMAILCIALGICVTTTIFSAVNAILIRPLPYPQADRLVAVYSENIPRGYHATNISYKDYASWRDENHTLGALGIWTWVTKTISEGESERVPGASVSANLFPLLGVRPILGRELPARRRTARALRRRVAQLWTMAAAVRRRHEHRRQDDLDGRPQPSRRRRDAAEFQFSGSRRVLDAVSPTTDRCANRTAIVATPARSDD